MNSNWEGDFKFKTFSIKEYTMYVIKNIIIKDIISKKIALFFCKENKYSTFSFSNEKLSILL